MIRRIIAALSVTAWLLPSFAFAYSTSAELAQSIGLAGDPRDISVILHGNSGQTYFSVWLNGSTQGSSPETIRVNAKATVDVFMDGTTMRSRYELLVKDKMAYLRLAELTGGNPALPMPAMLAELQGQWVATSLDPEALTDFQQMPLELEDLDPQNTGFEAVTANIINELFSFEHKRFTGGHAYRMSLRPDFLQRVSSLFAGAEGLEIFAHEVPASLPGTITTNIKVDTDMNDAFVFGRLHATANIAGFSFAFQSESTARVPVVSVIPPTNTIPLEEFLARLTGSSVELPALTTFTPPAAFSLPENAEPATIRVRAQLRTGQCEAEPGTLTYQQLVRKGVCPIVEDSRPRRGSNR